MKIENEKIIKEVSDFEQEHKTNIQTILDIMFEEHVDKFTKIYEKKYHNANRLIQDYSSALSNVGCAMNLRNTYTQNKYTKHYIERKEITDIVKIFGTFNSELDYLNFWLDFCKELGFPMELDVTNNDYYIITLTHSNYSSVHHYFATFQLSRYLKSYYNVLTIYYLDKLFDKYLNHFSKYDLFILASLVNTTSLYSSKDFSNLKSIINDESKSGHLRNITIIPPNSTWSVFPICNITYKNLVTSAGIPAMPNVCPNLDDLHKRLQHTGAVNTAFSIYDINGCTKYANEKPVLSSTTMVKTRIILNALANYSIESVDALKKLLENIKGFNSSYVTQNPNENIELFKDLDWFKSSPDFKDVNGLVYTYKQFIPFKYLKL
jgi:hypothetical protein